jgi:hypothetical protein
MGALRWFALVAGIWLLFNLIAMPLWWGGVNASGGVLGAIQVAVLVGFVVILLFDVVSVGWLMTRLCWVQGDTPDQRCEKGWLLVLGFLAFIGLMGGKVMVDEIARETPLGAGGGEWVVLYVCMTIQAGYILGVFLQGRGKRSAGEAR